MSWTLFWQLFVFELVAAITLMTFAGNGPKGKGPKDGD